MSDLVPGGEGLKKGGEKTESFTSQKCGPWVEGQEGLAKSKLHHPFPKENREGRNYARKGGGTEKAERGKGEESGRGKKIMTKEEIDSSKRSPRRA